MIFHKDKTNEQRDHERYYVQKPDKDFNPQRNRFIINKTIKDYEANRSKKNKEFIDDLGERSEATASWLKYVGRGGMTPIEKWIGRKEMARLRGEQIRKILRPDGSFQLVG